MSQSGPGRNPDFWTGAGFWDKKPRAACPAGRITLFEERHVVPSRKEKNDPQEISCLRG